MAGSHAIHAVAIELHYTYCIVFDCVALSINKNYGIST